MPFFSFLFIPALFFSIDRRFGARVALGLSMGYTLGTRLSAFAGFLFWCFFWGGGHTTYTQFTLPLDFFKTQTRVCKRVHTRVLFIISSLLFFFYPQM